MIIKLAHIEARRDALPQTLEALRALVDEVGRKEGGTASFKAYHAKDEPTRILLHMSFRTPSAEQYHRGTPWMKAFLAKLAASGIAAPTYVDLVEVLPEAR